jgi:hypothetical protein
MPGTTFDQNLYPVGRGSQGSNVFFVPFSALMEDSPEPTLPPSCAEGSAAMARAMAAAALAEEKACHDSPLNRSRSFVKHNRGISPAQAKSIAFDRFVNGKPEDLYSFAKQLFRNTNIPDPGKLHIHRILTVFMFDSDVGYS